MPRYKEQVVSIYTSANGTAVAEGTGDTLPEALRDLADEIEVNPPAATTEPIQLKLTRRGFA